MRDLGNLILWQRVKRCFEKVRTWPLAKDKLHFSADAKDDLVEHWCEMLIEAPFVHPHRPGARALPDRKHQPKRRKTEDLPRMRSPAIPPRDVPLPFRKRPVPAEPGVEDEAVEWVDEVIAEFEAGDFLHVMEGLLDMREAALCSFSEGGLSESGKKRLCHGLATICSQRAGPNSWLHGGSGGVVSVNRFAALVSERLPVELQRLVAMALWKKGKVEVLVPENHCLRNGRFRPA